MLLMASVSLLWACAEAPERSVEELDIEALLSQCGPTWDVQDVESYNGTLGVTVGFVNTHEGPVGYHVDVGCSGTLIAPDLFLSAGHCQYLVGDTVRFNYQDDPNGNPRPTTDYTVTAVLEQENSATWDYAIVRLNGNAGNTFGTAVMHHSDFASGNTVAVIQHPNRVPKVVDAGPLVDYNSPVGSNWFRHAVDTVGGSSGSGVIGSNGRLVGLHTNAGCSTGSNVAGNNAMRMSRLLDYSPTLQSIFPGWSYCTPGDPCPDGFGDCDSNADCDAGTVCVNDVGANYGWANTVDVCEGSSQPSCPWQPGDWNYCRDCGPCLAGEGDCEPGECAAGLVCATDVGPNYGWAAAVDVCE
ncbi:MAG: trypsin-like peptidase domain-containing protein [Myxococcota bacterium]